MTREFFLNNERIKKYINDYPELQPLYENPTAHWLASKGKKPLKHIPYHLDRLFKRAGDKQVTLVIYNIFNRDLGNHSRGGSQSRDAYNDLIDDICEGIGSRDPIIIYEPDALAHAVTHFSTKERLARELTMKKSVRKLSEKTNASIYLDIGHCNWLSSAQVVRSLVPFQSYINGFSVNVSNYYPMDETAVYAHEIIDQLPRPTNFIIDTSRNGNPEFSGDWCNPPGRRLGPKPTFNTGIPNCDAFMWIKVPGESDGHCKGGPAAGVFWLEQALELCKSS